MLAGHGAGNAQVTAGQRHRLGRRADGLYTLCASQPDADLFSCPEFLLLADGCDLAGAVIQADLHVPVSHRPELGIPFQDQVGAVNLEAYTRPIGDVNHDAIILGILAHDLSELGGEIE
jgi:hypothetical protein